MDIRHLVFAAALTTLAGCQNVNPFTADFQSSKPATTEDTATTTDGIAVEGNGLPPGTPNPSPDLGIIRFEASEGDDFGGLSRGFTYDAATDTIVIDNIAFDGGNTYTRGVAVGSVNGFPVYSSAITVSDPLTGNPIPQVANYRALVGFSTNQLNSKPRTAFVINRTGGYVQYGFGGYVYQREGGVTIPTSGQAVFNGKYAGLRVFDKNADIEFTEGDAQVAIDFDDFNDNAAVAGSISNRNAYTTAGASITLGGAGLVLPNLQFLITKGSSAIDQNGEMTGSVASYSAASGTLKVYEEGTYFAILAGDATSAADGGEVVGVIVVTSDDPRYDNVKAQETGGFIAYR